MPTMQIFPVQFIPQAVNYSWGLSLDFAYQAQPLNLVVVGATSTMPQDLAYGGQPLFIWKVV